MDVCCGGHVIRGLVFAVICFAPHKTPVLMSEWSFRDSRWLTQNHPTGKLALNLGFYNLSSVLFSFILPLVGHLLCAMFPTFLVI